MDIIVIVSRREIGVHHDEDGFEAAAFSLARQLCWSQGISVGPDAKFSVRLLKNGNAEIAMKSK